MKYITKEEKVDILSRVYWDMDVDPEKLLNVLSGKTDKSLPFDIKNFYARLLKTCDWYTLLKIIPDEKLKDVLSDEILVRLYPKDLRDRFLYVRSILQG